MRFISNFGLILVLALASISSASGQASPQSSEIDALQEKIVSAIEPKVMKILTSVELLEEQVEPLQKASVRYFASILMEQGKMQRDRTKMQESGQRGRDGSGREAMMQRRQKMEALRTAFEKQAKEILNNKQFRAFKNAMEDLSPQQRRGPRAGRGGR